MALTSSDAFMFQDYDLFFLLLKLKLGYSVLKTLARKHVAIKSAIHIGKESNNLEQAEIIGVQEGDCIIYDNLAEEILAHKEKILHAEPKDVKRFGISQQTLYNVKQAIVDGTFAKLKLKTIQRLLAYCSASFS